MRKSAILDSLFPRTRQGVLAATFVRPEKWWFLSELAEYLKTTPSSLQRELSSLVGTGILEQRREGNRLYFRAQRHSPIYRELKNLFEKTAGIVAAIGAAIAPFGSKVVAAFVYGSMARAQEHAGSDIDLMIIGEVGLAELTPALRKTQRDLGRELNATVFAVPEFRDKVNMQDHFLISVLKRPKQFLKGSERELEQITRK